MNERDGHIDVVSRADAVPSDAPNAVQRPWIGVLFECCGAYSRVYRDSERPQYDVQCPVCGARSRVRVSPEGVKVRFLRAGPC